MNVRNPEYNVDGTIDCDLWREDLGEWVPFTATADDPDEAEGEIYSKLISGDFGSISPCGNEKYEAEARFIRDSELLKIDKIATNALRWNSLSTDQQNELSAYRQALLDVPQQSGFPNEIEWPAKPECMK